MEQTVNNLVCRLQCTKTSESLLVLQGLQALARVNPLDVGNYSIQALFDFLKKENVTPDDMQEFQETFQETLDLICRLVNSRDSEASLSNTKIVLGSEGTRNVELLLNLLENKDMTIGIMASQILTELHRKAGPELEVIIQDCQDGMLKLLRRLPDASREEVRNQCISLVQQLTASNEDMRDIVAFNEGFDILFSIIAGEGGAADAGYVIQDCLRICCNILKESETRQRLFFEMDSGWCSKLCEFYDPRVLENLESLDTLVEDASLSPVMESSSIPWFEEPSRVLCASLALQTLSEAVGKSNRKFKNKVAFSPNLLINTAFWLARRGPVEILVPCLNLLEQMVAENPEVRDEVVKVSLRVSVPKRGKHVPHSFEQSVRISGTSHLTFGWWPLKEDQKFILIPALLAERYIFSDAIWAVENIPSNRPQYTDVVAQGCLRVLDSILSVDPTYSGLLLQFILAAPPPELDEDVLAAIGSPGKALETMKPIGVLILNTLLEASNRCILANKYSRASSIEVGDGAVSTDLEIVQRCGDILLLILFHGDDLARELFGAISTSHTTLALAHQPKFSPEPLPSYLLSVCRQLVEGEVSSEQTAGGTRRARYVAVASILQLLAVAVRRCERTARLLLATPESVFITTLASEAAVSNGDGRSNDAQLSACLFLGACFLALKDLSSGTGDLNRPLVTQNSKLSRMSLFKLISMRVGIDRFIEVLKSTSVDSNTCVTASAIYRQFYEREIETIHAAIEELASASDTARTCSPINPTLYPVYTPQTTVNNNDSCTSISTKSSMNSPMNSLMTEVKRSKSPIQSPQKLTDNASYKFPLNTSSRSPKEDELNEADKLLMTPTRISRQKGTETSTYRASSAYSDSSVFDNVAGTDTHKMFPRKSVKFADDSPVSNDAITFTSHIGTCETTRQSLAVEVQKYSTSFRDLPDDGEIHQKENLPNNIDIILKSWVENWAYILEAISSLAAQLGVEVSDMLIDARLTNEELEEEVDKEGYMKKKASVLANVLLECCSEQHLVAGTCSDIVEAAGISLLTFTSAEGTLSRIRECFVSLAESLRELREIAEEKSAAAREAAIADSYALSPSSIESSSIEKMETETNTVTMDFKAQEELILVLRGDAHRTSHELELAREKLELVEEELGRYKNRLNQMDVIQQELMLDKDAVERNLAKSVQELAQVRLEAMEKVDVVENEMRMQINKLSRDSELRISEEINSAARVREKFETALAEQKLQLLKEAEAMAAHQAQEMIRAIELDAAHTCSAQLEEVSALKRKLEETAGQLMKELEEKTVVKNLLEEQKQVALDLQQELTLVQKEVVIAAEQIRAHELNLSQVNEELSHVKQKYLGHRFAEEELTRKLEALENLLRDREYELSTTQRELMESLALKNSAVELLNIERIHNKQSTFSDVSSSSPGLFSITPTRARSGSGPPATMRSSFTPTTNTPGSLTRWKSATSLLHSMTYEAKEIAKLNSDILKQQKQLSELNDAHRDLLSLLAQQEVELSVFQSTLTFHLGPEAVQNAFNQAKRESEEKYGSYTDFRNDGDEDSCVDGE